MSSERQPAEKVSLGKADLRDIAVSPLYGDTCEVLRFDACEAAFYRRAAFPGHGVRTRIPRFADFFA